MKKVGMLLCALTASLGVLSAAACDGEKNIMVVSREDGSGTRTAFEEIVKKDGVKLQDATLTSDMEMAGETGVVISKVETNATAIGYVSLSSVGDTVKKVKVNGVEATVENVQNGSYQMKRPFVLLTSTQYTLTPAAQDFFHYCMSEEARDEIEAEGCILSDRTLGEYTTAIDTLQGTVKVEGSTSMKLLMTALIGEYKTVQPNVTVQATYNGSSNGRSAVQEDTTGSTVGIASSAKASDKYDEHTLCLDAIAVIVNKSNTLDDLSVERLFDIYTGAVVKFSEIR